MKGPGLILAPFAVVYAAKVALQSGGTWDGRVRIAIKLTLPAVLIGALVLGAFGTGVIGAFKYAVDTRIFSGNGLNLCWVITHYIRLARPEMFGGLLPDGTAELIRLPPTHSLKFWMHAAFFAVYGMILLIYTRRTSSLQDLVLYSLLGYLAYFVLNTGVHENHLFYAAILSVVLFLIDCSYIYHAVICCLALNVNMVLFYGLTGAGLPFSRVVGIELALPFACLNVILFLVALAPIFRPVARRVSIEQRTST